MPASTAEISPEPSAITLWRRLNQRFGPMCWVSVTSLMALACLLHFHEREEYRGVLIGSLVLSAVLWPCYLWEYLAARKAASPRTRERFWCCILPPLRLAARDHETGAPVWLPPSYGWQTVSPELSERLDRAGNTPMIAIALLVLPLIAMEFYYAERIEVNSQWAASIAAATALIWFAFALEFVVMCSLAERKWDYCLKHWLDLAIILLPLVAFLRALRLGRLLRLQQELPEQRKVCPDAGCCPEGLAGMLVLEIVRRLLHGRPEKQMQKVTELIATRNSRNLSTAGRIDPFTGRHRRAGGAHESGIRASGSVTDVAE